MDVAGNDHLGFDRAHVLGISSEAPRTQQSTSAQSPFAPSANSYRDRVLPESLYPQATTATVESNVGRRTFSAEARVQTMWGPMAVAMPSSANVLSGRAVLYGAQVEATRDTYNYGRWLANANLASRAGQLLEGFASIAPGSPKIADRFTLQNAGFPLTSAVLADVTVGDIPLDVIRTIQANGRLGFSGRSALRGASGAFRSVDNLVELRIGIAERGRLDTSQYTGFIPSAGVVSWLGFGYRGGAGISLGLQALRATQLGDGSDRDAASTQYSELSLGRVVATTRPDRAASSLVAAVNKGELSLPLADSGSWAGRVVGLLNHVDSVDANAERVRKGIFAEGRFRSGAFTHEMALRLGESGLLFADRYLVSATRGASWAVAKSRASTSWGLNVDYSQFGRASADDSPTTQLSVRADANWRFGKEHSLYLVGAASLERSDVRSSPTKADVPVDSTRRAVSLSGGYRFPFSGYGVSSVTGTLRQNDVIVTNGARASGWQAGWEHEWFRQRRDSSALQVRTGIGYAFERGATDTRRYPTASLTFRSPSSAAWSIDGALRYSAPNSNLTVERGLSGSISVTRKLAGNWTAGLTASANEAQLDVALSLATPNALPLLSRRSERSAILWLRWESSHGVPYAPQGIRTLGVAGAGEIVGSVVSATDDDGRLLPQTTSRGLAGVVVWLDDRYSAVTDSDGRFEFPLVPVGLHRVRLGIESVPLPWELESEGRLSLDVSLREKVEAQFKVRKIAATE